MEQSVNTFAKGLQMDTHPMVLGNDTLSDCLNGTMITMSGNEVVLQNDMGNRRIDNAFLPSGYLPLGMKEYGGVIYVAAYNSLTNRGLIGSFPSPLRKVNINKDKGGFLDFNSFINTYTGDDNRKFGRIELEYIIIPLSDKIVLHTGDKFSIYSSQISEFLLYLLPDNIDKRKNNLFTFQVGVFNSLNEFVDITNKLKIWDNEYFINTESNIPNETIADNDLLKARNKLAINTYSQKMSSPLYLKAIINHVSNLSASIIEAEFTNNNTKAKLIIEVTYQYNCPDNINNLTFEMLFNGKKTTIIEEESPIYLEEFNEYSKKIKYEVTINNLTPQLISGETRYEYELKFPLLHNFEEWNYPIYVESLNKTGSIDLSKIGSNTIIFKGYRYFNNTSTKMTTLEVNLESYPKKDSKIYVEVKAIAHDVSSHVNDGSTKDIGKIEKPGVGIFTLTFPYETFGERELYLLSFTKKDENNSNIVESLDKYISVNPNKLKNHFFITTGIFNGNYIGKKFLSEEDKNQFYQDGELIYSYDYIKDIYIEDFSEILKLDLVPILKYTISNDTTESKLKVTGNYIFPANYNVSEETYKINETWDIINTLDLYIEVNNQEVYPKEVDNALGVGTVGNKKLHINNIINRTINNELMSKNGSFYYYGDKDLYEYTNYKLGDDEHIITITEESNPISTSTNLLKILLKSNVSVNNILRGKLIEKNIFCEHVITSYWDFIRKHYYGTTLDRVLIKNPYFCVDYEGLDLASIAYTDKLAGVNSLKNASKSEQIDLNGKKADHSYIEEIVRDHISDIINTKSNGNLLVLEISTDDIIEGYLPCVQDYNLYGQFSGVFTPNNIMNVNFNATEVLPNGPGICGFTSFRRIWLKVNKLEYIPLFITCNKNNEGTNLGDSDDVVTYMYDDRRLHNLLQHIPHYYEYETGGKTLPEKVFNNTNYSRTKEFEVDSNIKLNILGEAILLNNSIFSLKHPLISEDIIFKEGVIHSSQDFEEDFDNINNYKISCVIMDGNYDNHMLYTKDCYGKYLDPLFIYYNDNECISYLKAFRPSYIPEKFYVEELGLYMPELKSSRKLYSGKNGENTLINEYVYPHSLARNVFKQKGGSVGGYYYGCNTLYIPNTNIEFSEYDITSKLYEGGDNEGNTYRFLPLRTKNIFDRTYIVGYGLTSENISSNIGRLKLD